MLIRYSKLAISAVYFLLITARRFFLKLFHLEVAHGCVALYYHSIQSREVASFRKQMNLVKRKCNVVRSDHVGRLASDRPNLIITFDDGFEGVLSNAAPILSSRGIPFTVFFISGNLGQKPAWDTQGNREQANEHLLSLAQIGQLPDPLLSIGSHTKTHPKLTEISRKRLTAELIESKRFLETATGCNVTTFSFPHGIYDANVLAKSLASGYERVFTIEPKAALRKADEKTTGRICTNGWDWYSEFWLKVHGGYNWLGVAFKMKKQLIDMMGIGRK